MAKTKKEATKQEPIEKESPSLQGVLPKVYDWANLDSLWLAGVEI